MFIQYPHRLCNELFPNRTKPNRTELFRTEPNFSEPNRTFFRTELLRTFLKFFRTKKSLFFPKKKFGSVRKKVRFGLVWFGKKFGSVRKSSVRFGLVRFGSVWFGSVRKSSVRKKFVTKSMRVLYIRLGRICLSVKIKATYLPGVFLVL